MMKGCVFMKSILEMTDDEITKAFQESVVNAVNTNREKGKPICGYDMILRKSYILYPDGRKEYAK